MAYARAISARMALNASHIESSLASVISNIQKASTKVVKDGGLNCKKLPTLVAVTKTKPSTAVQQAYDCGQRHFGENYVQELVDKATQFKKEGINDIKWHFIGHLQRNKANLICSIGSSLHMIQTVDNTKLADALNKAWAKGDHQNPLKILVQINTSQEESKSGCLPSECSSVVGHILDSCPHLQFAGLMTIGSPNHDYTQGDNPDFTSLKHCKQLVVNDHRLDNENIELSMGMSSDFEEAIITGADYVRVGSLIFGSRN